jgi:Fe-S cluster assembly iron-binding protein IscA
MPATESSFKKVQTGETHGQWSVNATEHNLVLEDAISATFRLVHRDTGRVVVDDASADILPGGVIEYTRLPADVLVSGRYLAQFTVQHSNGSTSKSQRISVTIEPSI